MSELPSGWVETRLGDIIQFNYGKGLPERNRSGSGFPVYGSNGVVGYHENALVSAESLVIGRKGSVGEVHHSRGPCWPIDTTYFVDQFSGMPARFWYYALKGLDVGGLNRATAIPGLNREDAYQVDVVLPPLTEQKRIADKLDAVLAKVDACRERLDHVPTILKRFRQAVLAAATSGTLTGEWEDDGRTVTSTIGSVCRLVNGYAYSSKDYQSSGIPLVRISDIDGRYARPSDKIFVPQSLFDEKFLIRKGDILVAMSGATTGKVGIYQSDVPSLQNQRVGNLKITAPERITTGYRNIVLMASSEIILGKAYGGAQPNISSKDIEAFEIWLPPIDQQDEIVGRVEALFAYADRLEARYTAARAQVERLTPALLAKAFRGELVPQDPNDEPASVLLERLRMARATSEGATGPKRRKGGGRPKTSKKSEVLMLTRKGVQDTHLTTILKERGPLTAEALWSASQLNIDDFYDQLKDEEARGLLREKRGVSSNAPRTLEAA